MTVAAQSTRLYHEEVALQAEFGTLLWLAFGDDDSHAQMVATCNTVVDAIEARDVPIAAPDRRTAGRRLDGPAHRLPARSGAPMTSTPARSPTYPPTWRPPSTRSAT